MYIYKSCQMTRLSFSGKGAPAEVFRVCKHNVTKHDFLLKFLAKFTEIKFTDRAII